MSVQKQPSHVRPEIWHTCASAAVKIPKLHSRVYYFPQGHLENASPSSSSSSSSITHTHSFLQSFRPFTPCMVSAVDLLADPHTDEVFVKLLLTPITNHVHLENPREEVANLNDRDEVVSFVKILTRSDVNNARSFHIPRFCADNVFPPLNIEAESSSQHLLVTDVHGEVSKFYHVCRGFPKRNMLYISEWNSFVKRKKLVAGDSVIFMKNSTGKLFVGIRRNAQFVAAETEQKKDELEKAVKLAEENKPFEVVYYPRGDDWCDFVVDGNVVDESMKIQWNPRMRVKMKTDKSSRIPYQGTISTVSRTSNLWRMLQVYNFLFFSLILCIILSSYET